MSEPSNPHNINIEFLRKKAKALLKDCRAGDAGAMRRIGARFPQLTKPDDVKLAHVQHALACEHGFTNWAALKRHDDPVDRFLVAIRGGALKDARRELAAFPEMADESIHAACAIGDSDALQHHLSLDASLVSTEHRGWPPLFYACASPLIRGSARQSAGVLECAKLLLDHGADVNASVSTDPSKPESRMTAIQRALMTANMPVMMTLMKRGASIDWKARIATLHQEQPMMAAALQEFLPQMRQAMETHASMLRDATQTLWGSDKWWFHLQPDYPAFGGYAYRPLLERGWDPNHLGRDGLTAFHHIARVGTVDAIELFLKHGADINRLTPDGKTPLVLAVRAGKNLNADALRAHGASDSGLRPVDELIGACLRVDPPEAARIVNAHPNAAREMTPDDFDVFIHAAAYNVIPQVRIMAQCGFDVGGFGGSGITALHAAAWHGHLQMLTLLLEFHAPLNVRDRIFGSSPLGWAAHGSRYCKPDDDAYREIVRILLAAGADHGAAITRAGLRPESIASARVAELL